MLNFRLPRQWDTKEMQTVIDACPCAEVQRSWCHNVEPEFWQGNAFQVGCLNKEGKDLVTCNRLRPC